jgi:hypothetical protein
MDGPVPARVPDRVIAEIRSRERAGLIELPKLRLEPSRAGSAGPAARSDWIARCPASARAGTRTIAAAGWSAAGRARKELGRGDVNRAVRG